MDYPYRRGGLRLGLRARLFLHGAKPACDVAYGEEQGVVSQKLDLAGRDFRFEERPILAYAAAADDYRPTFAQRLGESCEDDGPESLDQLLKRHVPHFVHRIPKRMLNARVAVDDMPFVVYQQDGVV